MLVAEATVFQDDSSIVGRKTVFCKMFLSSVACSFKTAGWRRRLKTPRLCKVTYNSALSRHSGRRRSSEESRWRRDESVSARCRGRLKDGPLAECAPYALPAQGAPKSKGEGSVPGKCTSSRWLLGSPLPDGTVSPIKPRHRYVLGDEGVTSGQVVTVTSIRRVSSRACERRTSVWLAGMISGKRSPHSMRVRAGLSKRSSRPRRRTWLGVSRR